jgi:ketosteroid isomerase-like protein
MPGSLLSLILAACVALGGCGAAAPAVVAPVMPEATDAAVRGALEQWRQAYEVRSVDALAKIYAQDGQVAVVQQGTLTLGWPAVQALLTSRLATAKEARVRLKDLDVVPLGSEGAAVTATMTREISDGVTTVTEGGIVTFGLRARGGAWSIVSEHYSYAVR